MRLLFQQLVWFISKTFCYAERYGIMIHFATGYQGISMGNRTMSTHVGLFVFWVAAVVKGFCSLADSNGEN